MKIRTLLPAIIFIALTMLGGTAICRAAAQEAQDAKDNDQTLRAMRDEMARAKSRLELKIPGTDQPVRPHVVDLWPPASQGGIGATSHCPDIPGMPGFRQQLDHQSGMTVLASVPSL